MILTYNNKKSEKDILEKTPRATLKVISGEGANNKLIQGDNLPILKTLLDDYAGKVDLIYIDPPFAKNKKFKTKDGEIAYSDTLTGEEFIEFLRERLIFLRELLSKNGSIYVHLDSTIGHYVKVIMDEIFGERNFRREIVWDIQALSGFKTRANNWIRAHDVILYYSVSNTPIFNKQHQPHRKEYLDCFDKTDEQGRRYYDIRKDDRRYLDDVIKKGRAVGDVWYDIMSFQQASSSSELTGYPTQKPKALLERIIKASSNEKDLVLDCFAGSGTTLVAAQLLNRNWIGIDESEQAIQITKKRLMELPPSLFTESDFEFILANY